MERYDVNDLGGMSPHSDGDYVLYADAQATVEALQREIATRDSTDSLLATRIRETTAALDAERHENMKQLEELRQQVGELQREKDEANEVVEALASKVAEQSIELNGDPQNFHGRGRTIGLRASLTQLQGLVRALPVAVDVYTHKEGRVILAALQNGVNEMIVCYTDDTAKPIAALLTYRATLKGGDGE